jgi:hypothetical protein
VHLPLPLQSWPDSDFAFVQMTNRAQWRSRQRELCERLLSAPLVGPTA